MEPTDLQIAADFLEENGFPEDVISFLRNMPAAIVTGSRKYGVPREDSDLDLVVLVSKTDFALLASVADQKPNGINSEGQPQYDSDAGYPFRFGRLNLLACDEADQWSNWKDGTDALATRASAGETITRDEAKRVFRKIIGERATKRAAERSLVTT
jgi:hypothetical protein